MRKNPIPRWRGFNLLEMFVHDNAYRSSPTGPAAAPFRREDFTWIAEWGFDFVRLPMSYRCWSHPARWFVLDERMLAQVDEAVEYGRRCGLHVCLNLHRVPGYCVNPPDEPRSIWREAEALEACRHHWRTLARRYAGISSERLSFDLLNEPPAPGDAMTRAEHAYVIRALAAAIREIDPDRLIIADGLACGNEPVPELADLDVAQSCRAYLPMAVSHFGAPWVDGARFSAPRWPGAVDADGTWDRARLEAHYARWAALMDRGIGVHCGEGGCFRATPHTVFLAWFRDVLEILTGYGIGYALWNFRGSFGILDSGRPDVAYADWHGHALDTELLTLLQSF